MRLIPVLAILALTTMSASAHQSFAGEYDAKKLVVVSGTVTAFVYTTAGSWDDPGMLSSVR